MTVPINVLPPLNAVQIEAMQEKGIDPWRFGLKKGEVEGHPFRGNQYTSGEGGARDASYRIQHQPSSEGAPAYDLNQNLSMKDFYEHPQYYSQTLAGDFDDYARASRESLAAIFSIRDHPDQRIRIYRASPKGSSINPKDWVTLSPTYAQIMGRISNDPKEDEPVHSRVVQAKDLRWPGDDINEFGYFPAEPFTKGDVPGHAFHGNQHTGGIGGDDSEAMDRTLLGMPGPPSGTVGRSDERAIATAQQMEARYKDAPIEHMVIISKDGTVLADIAGSGSHAEGDVPRGAEGGVITHNHPATPDPAVGPGAFVVPTLSDADLRAAREAQVREIRVVSQDTGKVYSMRLGSNPTDREQMLFEGTANSYLKHEMEKLNAAFQAAGGASHPENYATLVEKAKQVWSDTWAHAAAQVPSQYAYEVSG